MHRPRTGRPAPAPLDELLCLGFRGVMPELGGAPRRTGAGAALCGRVRLGAGAILHAYSVIRGDGHDVDVGTDFHLGERSTVHIAHEQYPAIVGHEVTVGRNAVVHACRIGDRCVLEDNTAVLDGAVVGAGSVLTAGSIVYPRAELPAGHLCRGSPAVAFRRLEPGELMLMRGRVRNASAGGQADAEVAIDAPAATAGFAPAEALGWVAPTAQVEGRLALAPDASVWFGCALDGGPRGILVGAGSNIQDNTVIYAMSSPVKIGAGVTVGHNVSLQDCEIGDFSLIGMASFVAPGTVIEADVLLAAGSSTQPRQVLEGGWLWGGRPARRIAPMTDERRQLIRSVARIYCEYAVEFARSVGAGLAD
ncbi:MAG TPA: gamma carbonic anhydrase family protein [Burkholderiaceae bacterium]